MSDPTTPTWQITALSTGESIGPDCYTRRSKRPSFSPANLVHSDASFPDQSRSEQRSDEWSFCRWSLGARRERSWV